MSRRIFAAVLVLLVALVGGSNAPLLASAAGEAAAGGTTAPPPPAVPETSKPPFAVGERVLQLIDSSRTLRLPGGRREPRKLTTVVRYPAQGTPGPADAPNALPATGAGPFPLIVFGHGFAVTPATYAALLHSWASAGYVVAAPVFPLGNANAPGGPTEADLVNQPRDMSFVISRMLGLDAAPGGSLAGMIAPTRIAVAGQSDGAETALAVAYSRRLRDPRVAAAVVLAGAMMSGIGGYSFAGGPPLLAVQGTRDVFNEPRYTYAYFALARRPKYMLRLIGAEHLPPYTRQQPQLGIVERVSTAFLDGYLKNSGGGPGSVRALGTVRGVSQLLADP
jgi:dienelactone hydrolase